MEAAKVGEHDATVVVWPLDGGWQSVDIAPFANRIELVEGGPS